jgi:hypothetical protein
LISINSAMIFSILIREYVPGLFGYNPRAAIPA